MLRHDSVLQPLEGVLVYLNTEVLADLIPGATSWKTVMSLA